MLLTIVFEIVFTGLVIATFCMCSILLGGTLFMLYDTYKDIITLEILKNVFLGIFIYLVLTGAVWTALRSSGCFDSLETNGGMETYYKAEAD